MSEVAIFVYVTTVITVIISILNQKIIRASNSKKNGVEISFRIILKVNLRISIIYDCINVISFLVFFIFSLFSLLS